MPAPRSFSPAPAAHVGGGRR